MGGRGKSLFPGFGVGGSCGGGLPGPKDLPLDQPQPSDRPNPHLPSARNKSWLLEETCEVAPTAVAIREITN